MCEKYVWCDLRSLEFESNYISIPFKLVNNFKKSN